MGDISHDQCSEVRTYRLRANKYEDKGQDSQKLAEVGLKHQTDEGEALPLTSLHTLEVDLHLVELAPALHLLLQGRH